MHVGKIVQQLIKESPQTLTGVASQMDISRNTLYSRFRAKTLPPSFLFSLGKVINVDFKAVFPHLATDKHYQNLVSERETSQSKKEEETYRKLEIAYYRLLENHNKLLKFLLRIIKEHNLHLVDKEFDDLLKNNRIESD